MTLTGDDWIDNANRPVLRIPSAIIPPEYNYLINPKHPLFNKLKIGAPVNFSLDPRFVQQSTQDAEQHP